MLFLREAFEPDSFRGIPSSGLGDAEIRTLFRCDDDLLLFPDEGFFSSAIRFSRTDIRSYLYPQIQLKKEKEKKEKKERERER